MLYPDRLHIIRRWCRNFW